MGQYTTFTFKHQSGGRGYYTEVDLDIHLTEGECGLEIRYEDQASPQWREAAMVGVRNAWRCVPAKVKVKAHATVRVLRIAWQPAETTDITVVYSVAHAVFKSLGIQPREHPKFIESFGAFLFPK